MQDARVGLIGLGFMGSAVGRRLIERGFPLTVSDIAEEAVARMGERGAARARSAREVAAATDVVLHGGQLRGLGAGSQGRTRF